MFIFKTDQELWARELISRIISCDHSLRRKDIIRFILLFHDHICVQQCCHFELDTM
jgi:hypothetical protein